jgi:peptidoglycan/LPS O-acetylase OafA/YrhL
MYLSHLESGLSSSTLPDATVTTQRIAFLDTLRAVGAICILFHHFALYPPLSHWARPALGAFLDFLENHARTTQLFFGVSGYVLAHTLSHRVWNLRQIPVFLVQRYCRLGIPYLTAIALVLLAYRLGYGYLPPEVTGSKVTSWQLFTHLFFLQGILGQEQLSAGLWFVCINFQLCLMYVLLLVARDSTSNSCIDAGSIIGWVLAVISLFAINLDSSRDAWGLYFFPYFFMGVVAHRALQPGAWRSEFWLYQFLFVAALCFEWRWRLVASMGVGWLLFFVGRSVWRNRWQQGQVMAWLGKISYSVFLIHFPILVLVSTVSLRFGLNTPVEAVMLLSLAVILSLAAATVLHRYVEIPAGKLARLFDNSVHSHRSKLCLTY